MPRNFKLRGVSEQTHGKVRGGDETEEKADAVKLGVLELTGRRS